MVVLVDPRLSSVEVWWWNPFGAAIFAFSGGPTALFDEAVIRAAGQCEFVDIGEAICGCPAIDVVYLRPVARDSAARPSTAAVQRVQDDPLPRRGEAFCAATVELFAGVLVVDDQVVMRL